MEPQRNSATLTVSWLPPAEANGPLNIYEVKYARLKYASPGSQYLERDDVCADGNLRECCPVQDLINELTRNEGTKMSGANNNNHLFPLATDNSYQGYVLLVMYNFEQLALTI